MLSRSWPVLLFAVAALAGCSKEGGGVSAPNAAPNAALRSTDSAASEITYKTADGWTIHADYAPAPNATKAVILLHQRGGSGADWQPLVAKLNADGIAALAIDQRGAGRSQGAQNGNDAPWDTTPDIAGAVDWLKAKGLSPAHIGLAGASYGANNALLYTAAHPEIPAVALLSPGADYNGLVIQPAAAKYRGAVLILTASGDRITNDGPQIVNRVAPGPKELKTYDGQSHGVELFSSHPDSLDAVVNFFKSRL